MKGILEGENGRKMNGKNSGKTAGLARVFFEKFVVGKGLLFAFTRLRFAGRASPRGKPDFQRRIGSTKCVLRPFFGKDDGLLASHN
jgi:hypothetical protein